MSEMHTCNCQETTEEEIYGMLDGLIEEYREKPGALIPVLQITQRLFGYLPKDALKKIAIGLDKPYSEVAGVVSFYSFFSTQPRGKYLIRVCLGTACYVRGGKEVLAAIERELEVKVGETTADKLFSLDVGRCFGACGLAPVLMVNDVTHQRVKADKVSEIIDYYKATDKQLIEEKN